MKNVLLIMVISIATTLATASACVTDSRQIVKLGSHFKSNTIHLNENLYYSYTEARPNQGSSGLGIDENGDVVKTNQTTNVIVRKKIEAVVIYNMLGQKIASYTNFPQSLNTSKGVICEIARDALNSAPTGLYLLSLVEDLGDPNDNEDDIEITTSRLSLVNPDFDKADPSQISQNN